MASINAINNIITNNDLVVGNTTAGATASNIYVRKSRTGGIITTGDALGALVFTGNDGASDLVTSQITSTSSGTIAATRIGSNLKFYTHADAAGVSALRMTIADTGAVTIAAPDSGVGLTVTAGGLTVSSGGIGITAGGLTVTAGGAQIVAGGFTVTAGNTTLTPLGTAGHVVNSAAGVLSTSATTQFALQVGSATGAFSSLALGTSGQLLQSAGAGANPSWSTTTYPATSTKGDVVYASADNTLGVLAKSVASTRYLANTGVDNIPKWDQIGLTTGVTGVLPIANGGTNANAMTNTYGVNYFDGTSVVTTAVGTATHVLTSNGAGVAPTFQAIPASGLTWQTISGNWNIVANTGYVNTRTSNGHDTATLPAVITAGSVIRICQSYAGSFTNPGVIIAQNAGQQIFGCPYSTEKTTVGVGGSLSIGRQESVELVCTVDNTTFMVVGYIGTLTWV